MKALEASSYMDYCNILNNYLTRVEKINKEIEKQSNKTKSK